MSRILAIEDDKILQDIYQKFLTASGFEVKVVGHGADVPDALTQFKPEIILLDMMLPDIDGLTILKDIRRHYNLITLPVIVLSAKSTTDDVIEAMNCGANDYMIKPANHKELLIRINTQLNISKLGGESETT